MDLTVIKRQNWETDWPAQNDCYQLYEQLNCKKIKRLYQQCLDIGRLAA